MSGKGQHRRRTEPDEEDEVRPPTSPQRSIANGGGRHSEPAYRGLDSGLAKAAPSADGLSQKNYRSFRRRLELFSLQCRRRSKDAEIEGALLVVSLLKDSAWEACEQLDYSDIQSAERPFDPLVRLLDQLFQYEEMIEIPSRCSEFFEEFQRRKQEELQAYLVRHQSMMKKMAEVKITIPPLLAGWHLLTRAGVPRWTHVQVKSMCGGDLDYKKVKDALMRIFGGDHKPNGKDLNYYSRSSKDDTFYEDEFEEEFFEDLEEPEWWANEAYYEEEWPEDDEEIPDELESLADEVEDAFVNYMDSRKRMKELALARGFTRSWPSDPSSLGSKEEERMMEKEKVEKERANNRRAKEKASMEDFEDLHSTGDQIPA